MGGKNREGKGEEDLDPFAVTPTYKQTAMQV